MLHIRWHTSVARHLAQLTPEVGLSSQDQPQPRHGATSAASLYTWIRTGWPSGPTEELRLVWIALLSPLVLVGVLVLMPQLERWAVAPSPPEELN